MSLRSISHSSSSSRSYFSPLHDSLDSYFDITSRGSSVRTELRAGLVTFVTMAYILIVNAEVLSKSGPDKHGRSMSFEGVAVATALSASIGSALVGIFGNLPFGLAPGMGLNSYFTYGICLRSGLSWEIALTCAFVQGLLFMAVSLAGFCNLIQLYAPPCIKKSITVGLGLFQALIGFECMKLVVPGNQVLLQLGDIWDPSVILAMTGVMLVSMMLILDVKASMLIGMVSVTVIAWFAGIAPWPTAVVRIPSIGANVFCLDFPGYFHHFHSTFPITMMFLFVSIFDTAGVQFMAGHQAGLLDEDERLPGAKAAFCSAGAATAIGALLGTSPVIIHNETCAGIQDGARTGLAACTISVLFLLALPFIPVLEAVPSFATAPPLIVVGMLMMAAAKYIEWERVDEAMPAFLTATVLPLTYSIANGMIAGIIAFIALKSTAYFGGLFTMDEVNELSRRGSEYVDMKTINSTPGRRQNGSVMHSSVVNSGTLSNISPNSVRTGLVAFDDPMPGSPVPPFIDRPGMSLSKSMERNSLLVNNNGYNKNNQNNNNDYQPIEKIYPNTNTNGNGTYGSR